MDAIALACRTALLLSRIRLSRGMLLASLQIPFFVTVIVISAILGDLVARHFSEPINHLIRKRWS